jgi:DOPA 4,5-dioxygenase
MEDSSQPYHAHIYYVPETREAAAKVRNQLGDKMASGEIPQLRFIGQMKDYKAGPHPIPQFEIHYTKAALPEIVSFIENTGLTALVHPLTDDDVADHTSLAQWIGEPLDLDLATLDPPGHNQGVARFARADF